VKRASSLRIPTNNLADVYVGASAKGKQKPIPDYHIKGCYAKRSFTFLNKSGDVIAEVCFTTIHASCLLCPDFFVVCWCKVLKIFVILQVKPKQVRSAEIKLGGDVFNLVVWPGYDQAFVMGLIVILDQIMPSGWSGVDSTEWQNEIEEGICFSFSSSLVTGVPLRNNWRLEFHSFPPRIRTGIPYVFAEESWVNKLLSAPDKDP